MLRSIGAVILGYLAMAIPIFATTTWHMILVLGKMPEPPAHMDLPVSFGVVNLVYSTLFAAFGGFVCAAIASQNRLKHGLVLAGLVFVLSLVSVYIDRGQQPVWYQASLVLLGAPATAIGAWIRAKKEPASAAAVGA